MRSEGKFFALRLSPQQDLRKAIIGFAREQRIVAGAIITCVGSLGALNIRFANQNDGFTTSGKYEIVSLTGTFTQDYAHLHIAVSDHSGKTLGGHLLDGNLIFTTAELVLLELTALQFDREHDPISGYKELSVRLKQ